jgi:hypothetical protein
LTDHQQFHGEIRAVVLRLREIHPSRRPNGLGSSAPRRDLDVVWVVGALERASLVL